MKKFLLIALLFISGCAPWVEVGGIYKNDSYNYSVELPQEWLRFKNYDYLYITRDGGQLQHITLRAIRIDTPEPFPFTKKKLTRNMLPHEVAEVVLDNIGSNPNVLNFEVIENNPAKIGGVPGFKATISYKDKGNGVKYKGIYCGLTVGEWFYFMSYEAPLRHYFERDANTFEKVVESFKLIKMQ